MELSCLNHSFNQREGQNEDFTDNINTESKYQWDTEIFWSHNQFDSAKEVFQKFKWWIWYGNSVNNWYVLSEHYQLVPHDPLVSQAVKKEEEFTTTLQTSFACAIHYWFQVKKGV